MGWKYLVARRVTLHGVVTGSQTRHTFRADPQLNGRTSAWPGHNMDVRVA